MTTEELTTELIKRYNEGDPKAKEAIERLSYEYGEMMSVKEDQILGDDEEGEHGKPF